MTVWLWLSSGCFLWAWLGWVYERGRRKRAEDKLEKVRALMERSPKVCLSIDLADILNGASRQERT